MSSKLLLYGRNTSCSWHAVLMAEILQCGWDLACRRRSSLKDVGAELECAHIFSKARVCGCHGGLNVGHWAHELRLHTSCDGHFAATHSRSLASL
jgi:hypothetical protein